MANSILVNKYKYVGTKSALGFETGATAYGWSTEEGHVLFRTRQNAIDAAAKETANPNTLRYYFTPAKDVALYEPEHEVSEPGDTIYIRKPQRFAEPMLEHEFRAEFERRFPSLFYDFIVTMDEIGKLGRDKYKENAIENRIKRGDVSRGLDRIKARAIALHAANHFGEYLDGVKHDVYNTRKHQLAAAAFNPMMEFALAELSKEQK